MFKHLVPTFHLSSTIFSITLQLQFRTTPSFSFGYPFITMSTWHCCKWHMMSSMILCIHCKGNTISCGLKTNTCFFFHVFGIICFVEPFLKMGFEHLYTISLLISFVNIFWPKHFLHVVLQQRKTQMNEWDYWNCHSRKQYLPLTIEIFSCLHKQEDDFFHVCANNVWGMETPKGLHFSIFTTYFKQNVSIMLHNFKLNNSNVINYFFYFHHS